VNKNLKVLKTSATYANKLPNCDYKRNEGLTHLKTVYQIESFPNKESDTKILHRDLIHFAY